MKDYQSHYYYKKEPVLKKKIQLPVYILFQILLFFFFVFFMIFQNIRYKDLEKNFYNQIQENRRLDENILPIQLEIRSLTRNEILEKLATKRYLLKPARKEQIIQIEYTE